MDERVEDRRKQLIECAEAVAEMASFRNLRARHVTSVKEDTEIRAVLDTVVRRWTRLTPTHYVSRAARRSRSGLHREHVVPCRVLVDRMIMNPAECRSLLERAVIVASVTPAEHRRLGGIFVDHAELYGRMLRASVARLPRRGLERYEVTGIELLPV